MGENHMWNWRSAILGCFSLSSPQSTYDESGLIEFIINSCDKILSSSPGAVIDLNQLNLQNITLHTDLSQSLGEIAPWTHSWQILLGISARWPVPKVSWKQTILVFLYTRKSNLPPPKRHLAEFRDVREYRKVQILFGLLKHVDWSPVINEPNVRTAVHAFYSILKPVFDTCFPIIKVKVSSNNYPLYSSHTRRREYFI